MSTQHNSNPMAVQFPRRARCLRHHVSMAACDDCRAVRSAQIQRQREIRVAG